MSGMGMMLAFCACSSVSKGPPAAGHGADPMAGGGIGWTTLVLLLLLALSLALIHQLGCLAVRQHQRTVPLYRPRR